MTVDDALLDRLRTLVANWPGVSEKRMFGGICLMLNGHMLVGLGSHDALMVRVGPDQYENALNQPFAREMDFTGRPMRGFVYVDTEGLEEDDALSRWLERASKFVLSLPPK
ncbi:MAG: RNA methyltransferase [Lysobacteraceae bacterium]|nr:MAG: RNA methyltransferase [Xanthomonadaceae bacterium]